MSVRVDHREGKHSFQRIRTTISGKKIRFCVNNKADWIQRHHYQGKFYEAEELEAMSKYFSNRTRYLDVGANIGNHILYLCTFCRPREAVAIEPNPAAIELLELNLEHNGLRDVVNTSYLGQGLSDVEGKGVLAVPRDNLGGARFIESDQGQEGITIVTGDKLFAGKSFDFIKIDVEGMEIKVLNGMKALISRCRPTLFVEVANENAQAFGEWQAGNNYRIAERFRRYTTSENFLVVPIG